MGLIVNVFRAADVQDCTRNGVSARHSTLCVINVDGPFQPAPDAPAVLLDTRVKGALRLVPLDEYAAGKWLMFGGNFAHCSDARFTEACERILGHAFYGAVAIHDRVE